MSLISVLKSRQSAQGRGGRVCTGTLTPRLQLPVNTSMGLPGKSIPVFPHFSLSLAGSALSSLALLWGVKYFPLQDKLSFVSTCTARWVFAGLLTSSFPRSRAGAAGALSGGKSNRNLSITQLCPFCGQWAFCAGIPSVISELFFSPLPLFWINPIIFIKKCYLWLLTHMRDANRSLICLLSHKEN